MLSLFSLHVHSKVCVTVSSYNVRTAYVTDYQQLLVYCIFISLSFCLSRSFCIFQFHRSYSKFVLVVTHTGCPRRGQTIWHFLSRVFTSSLNQDVHHTYCTVCSRSLDPFYIVSSYMKWVETSLAYSKGDIYIYNIQYIFFRKKWRHVDRKHLEHSRNRY